MANLEQLRSTQSTPLLTPDDAGYAEAVRLWGAPASPDVLVRPTTEEEVGAALVWAAAEGVEVAVRSGAHGPWAPLPGGVLVDLGAFAQVDVADDGIVSVGSGATWVRLPMRWLLTASPSARVTPGRSAWAATPSGRASAGSCGRSGSPSTSSSAFSS